MFESKGDDMTTLGWLLVIFGVLAVICAVVGFGNGLRLRAARWLFVASLVCFVALILYTVLTAGASAGVP